MGRCRCASASTWPTRKRRCCPNSPTLMQMSGKAVCRRVHGLATGRGCSRGQTQLESDDDDGHLPLNLTQPASHCCELSTPRLGGYVSSSAASLTAWLPDSNALMPTATCSAHCLLLRHQRHRCGSRLGLGCGPGVQRVPAHHHDTQRQDSKLRAIHHAYPSHL